MRKHTWTDGKGVVHTAWQCERCGRWFDSPSLHIGGDIEVDSPKEEPDAVQE